jgi:hypothetical protein
MDNTYIHNIEQCILSSIIYDNKLLLFLIENGLESDDFHNIGHQSIFKSMCDLSKKYVDINELNLANENKDFEGFLLQILTTNPVSNPVAYLELLKDNRLKNNTILIAKKIINKSDSTGKELYAMLLESINNIQIDTMFRIKAIDDVEEKEIEVCCRNYLPLVKRTANTIVAKGDTGKSYLLLLDALHYQLEQIKNKTFKKCFCWFTEDDPAIIKERKNKLISEKFSIDDAALLKDPKYKDLLELSDELPFHFINKNYNKFEISEKFYMLQHILKSRELIILDPLASFIGVNENDNSTDKAFMDLIAFWAKKDDKYIALIHHTPGDKLKGRGGEAIRDSSKIQYFLTKPKDKEGKIIEKSKELEIIVDKDNYKIFKNLPRKFKLDVFPD